METILADMEARALARIGASSRDFAVDLNGYDAPSVVASLQARRYVVSATIVEDRGVAAVFRVIFRDKNKAGGGVSVHDIRRRIAEFIDLTDPQAPNASYIRAI